MQNNELKMLFKNNYSGFLKNILSLTYKVKYSYDLKQCRRLESPTNSHYIEISSNVRDIFNYSYHIRQSSQ